MRSCFSESRFSSFDRVEFVHFQLFVVYSFVFSFSLFLFELCTVYGNKKNLLSLYLI